MSIFFRVSRAGLTRERLRELKKLEKILGVRFRKPALLHQALIHRSLAQSEKPNSVQSDNETMEFLGDAVLGLVISDELFRQYPVSQVGDLAKVKAQVVSRATLGEIASGLKLDHWILMGSGEMMRGEGQRPSVIGSALEAVLGAIFLDQGLRPVTRLIKRLFHHPIEAVETGHLAADYKSLLQEYAFRYFKETPEYQVEAELGPSHQKRFQVSVGWKGKSYGQGTGPSKKAASQEAARLALEHLLAPLPEESSS